MSDYKVPRIKSRPSISHGLNQLVNENESHRSAACQCQEPAIMGWPISDQLSVTDSSLGEMNSENVYLSHRGSELNLKDFQKNNIVDYKYTYNKDNWVMAKLEVEQSSHYLVAEGNFRAQVYVGGKQLPVQGQMVKHKLVSIQCENAEFNKKCQALIRLPANKIIHQFLVNEFKSNQKTSTVYQISDFFSRLMIEAGTTIQDWLNRLDSLVDESDETSEMNTAEIDSQQEIQLELKPQKKTMLFEGVVIEKIDSDDGWV